MAFMRRVVDGYNHDYGTVCHALAASALAATWCANEMAGGITGFQSGFVMWGFVQHWLHLEGKPLRLVEYENMLYPQYERNFDKVITQGVWEYLQAEARKKLAEPHASDAVRAHLQSIAGGEVPFGYQVERNSDAD